MVARIAVGKLALTLGILGLLLAGSPAIAASAAKQPKTYIFHLNGIGGERICDHWLIDGLKAAGLTFDVDYYDWTHGNEGIGALQAYAQNRVESKKIAELLLKEYRARPGQRIIITCHSGGAGLATWALEQLPADVQIDTIIMLAPALSPQYDLSSALKHVKGNCYVFSSTLDTVVLSVGTRVFGTIDGIRCEAAGFGGFVMPKTADEAQYKKLIAQPYQEAWLSKFGNAGSHICSMRPKFAKEFIAPILLTGQIPVIEVARPLLPTTRPVGAQAKATVK